MKRSKKPARKPAKKTAPAAKKRVAAIPAGYHTVTPHLVCRGAAKAIEFYKKAFGAKERLRMSAPDGSVAHAEITIGNSTVMLGDEAPQMGATAPQTIGGTAVSIFIYTDGRRQAVREGDGRRRDRRSAADRHVLGRPLRQAHRSLRPQVVDGDARRGRLEEGNGQAHRRRVRRIKRGYSVLWLPDFAPQRTERHRWLRCHCERIRGRCHAG